MEKILDMVNQNVHNALKTLQDTKNKEHDKTQKEIKELREDTNKHQSETKDTVKKEKQELKMTTQIIKELNTDLENLRRKNQTEILEVKSPYSQKKKHSGRPLQQTRNSGRQDLSK
jgi:signal transduction histidine kinase